MDAPVRSIMERYDLLYRLYDEFDTDTLGEYQEFVDLFPPVDSRVALDHWEEASEELTRRKGELRESFPGAGETFADLAALISREQAFAGLDLYNEYDRGVNVLVLPADRSVSSTSNTSTFTPRSYSL